MKIEIFLFCFLFGYLFMNGIMVIVKKYNIIKKLEMYSLNKSYKFLYELSGCEFCIEHHVSIVPTIILLLMNYFEWYLIFIPFLIASFSNLIKTHKTNENNRI
jgi:uncharacterized membrane protein